MTNEFKHGSVGDELAQTEWEAIGAHVFDSQSTGDILYASSGTQLSRLGIGSTNNLLTISGGIPAWTATPTVTSLATTSLTTSSFALGTSSSPETSATNEKEFIGCYLESSGQTSYGMRIQLEKTSATAGAPRALTLRTILGHSSGFTPQGANSVDARVTLETGNTGISGEMHAMESQCRVDAESRVVQGTYAAHKFTNQFGANNTMPASTFFHRFYDAGDVKTPLMYDFSGLTADSSNCIVADTGAVPASTYYLRVKCPDDSTGYIPICGGLS